MNSKIIGITGHRDLSHSEKDIKNVLNQSLQILLSKNYSKIISGMAQGFDQIVAQSCVDLQIPFIAAVPYDTHGFLWKKESKDYYEYILSKAEEIVNVCPGPYEKWKFLKRDEWIVDRSDLIVSYLAPGSTKGGTFYTVEYAKRKNKTVKNIFTLLK